MGGAVETVADAGADLIPYLETINASLGSIEQALWVLIAVVFAAVFAYFAVRWWF